MKKRIGLLTIFSALIVFTACGKVADQEEPGAKETVEMPAASLSEEAADGLLPENEKRGEGTQDAGTEDAGIEDAGTEASRLIENQTFGVRLEPFGEVTFASYGPDIVKEPLADAVFCLERAGEKLYELPGVYEGNVRANEIFNGVEAVSFPDIDQDGYDDIIIICSYSPASGPEVGSGYNEARIYMGSAEGIYRFERELSEQANSALAEITVDSVRAFLGVGRGEAQSVSWQEAYREAVSQAGEEWEGFSLIYLNDDDIPELVKIGAYQAAGCQLVWFYNDKIFEAQLDRLNFTYLPREGLLCNSDGLMDCYYDLVYRLEDGQLHLVARGEYGAPDNSHVELDENGEPIYVYRWEDVEMSAVEYRNMLQSVFDFTRAKAYGYPGNSREEMLALLADFGG